MAPDPVDQLLETARKDVDRGWLPACQLAVARDDELLCFETFGDATNATRFQAFSATKPIVASAVWLLIGDGDLDITRSVADYVPEFATNGKHVVTVEQVLLHTGGFPNAPMDALEGADARRRRARFETWRLEWEPGSRFEYHAGAAHWVLVDLIERLTGADFRDVVEQRVCTPIGLPRVLGIASAHQDDVATLLPVGDTTADAVAAGDDTLGFRFNDPAVRAAGVPGGGAIMTAADLARFYQALMHDTRGVWNPDVLADATGNIRCTLPEPLFDLAVNRSIGLVIAGDDGKHTMRYAGFGDANSPRAFGHAGLHMQVGWGDPESGLSFAYFTNGVDTDVMREGVRGVVLAGLAARC
jgi:CubicO group peptidase (beta-lactamase class C family)